MTPVRGILFTSGTETIAGDLVLPDGEGPHPALLTVAGTGPQNRYGDWVEPDGTIRLNPRHRWVGERLAAAGIAQLRYDKRGVGESTGGGGGPGAPPGRRDEYADVLTDVEDAESAVEFLAAQPEIDSSRITVMGTSAGVYFSCLLAARSDIPSSYILWAGVHMDIADFGDLLYGTVLKYARRGDDELQRVADQAPDLLGRARRWPDVVAAARAGAERFEWSEDGEPRSHSIMRLSQELAFEYPKQFTNIETPVMVIHGDRDINVPVAEASAVADALRVAGNDDVTLTIVPGADHGMYIAPPGMSLDDRMMRFFNARSDHPHSEFFINSVIGWIRDLTMRHADEQM